MLIIKVIAGFATCAIYSTLYLFVLGLRIIRTKFDGDRDSGFILGLLVSSAVLTATVSLEAAILLPFMHEISGRLLYATIFTGAITLVMGLVGVASKNQKPIQVALGHKAVSKWGLIIGNFLIVVINYLASVNGFPLN